MSNMQVKKDELKLVKSATIKVRDLLATVHMGSAKAVKEKGHEGRAMEKLSKARSVEDRTAFGMWADREEVKDVHAWLRKIRTPRYLRDGGTLFSPPPQKPRRKRKS
jgi:hypothetical protein